MKEREFSALIGKTVASIERGMTADDREVLTFNCTDGQRFAMYHEQDCCEHVTIEDICGDLNDMVDSPILFAEESSQDTIPDGATVDTPTETPEWTFYRVRTNKGSVVIRWFGASDYYSTRVSFMELCE